VTTATRPASRTPPRALMRGLVNPVVRTVLGSPAGRWCGPLLLLEVTGRRTGRRRRIPVVGHVCAGRVYALTDAPWAANFTGGTPVLVTRRGRRITARGVLLPPAAESAAVVRQVIATEGPRALGLVLPADRAPTDEELCRLRRVVLLDGLERR
jgi:F420H(2)-dependent quinone reductase